MTLQAILDAIEAAGEKQVGEIEAEAGECAQEMLLKARAESDYLREEARLSAQGVDILRVHNVAAHAAAYRGWSHVA